MFKKLASATAALLVALMPLMSTHVYAATGTNLITNPGVEAGAANAADGWAPSNWGTNTFTTTTVAGHASTRALQVKVTAFTDGAVNWYQNPGITVTAGQSYQYEVWYQSDVATQVGAEFVGATTPYMQIATLPASPGVWTKYTATFTAPAGSTSVTVFNILASVGTLMTDDYSLTSYTATPFNRPIVSVTFDDGWANQSINGKQVLKDNNINATFYLISEPLATGLGTAQEYMNASQAQALFADGHEIASHTIDHCSLNGTTKDAACATPTAAFVTNEMTKSKNDLQTLVPGSTVTNFAYPYGEYSTESINIGKGLYASQRTVECGYNSKDSLDLTKLKGCEVDASTSVADIKALIDNAIAQKTWLVLFYHEIANAGQGVVGDEAYTTPVADFTAIMQYINSRKADIDNMSVAKAIAAINGTVVPPVTKPGDVNGDNLVDALDLSTLLSNWNKTAATAANGDINADGTVDALDLSTLLANWSK